MKSRTFPGEISASGTSAAVAGLTSAALVVDDDDKHDQSYGTGISVIQPAKTLPRITQAHRTTNTYKMSSTTDPKQAVMDQVRQQAALSNARLLVEVSRPCNFHSSHASAYAQLRNSTSTASSAAYQNPAPRFPPQNRRATLTASTSTWRRGTL